MPGRAELDQLSECLDSLVLLQCPPGQTLRPGGRADHQALQAGSEGGQQGGNTGRDLETQPAVQSDGQVRHQLHLTAGEQHQVEGRHHRQALAAHSSGS